MSSSKEKLNDKVKNSNLRRTKMNSSKIGQNEPCPCGSGKKYKRCCWSKETENKQVLEPRDSDQIHVLYTMGLTATYPASIKLKDGKIISGRRELKCAIPQCLGFHISDKNSDLGKFLSNWDLDIKHKFAELFLSEFNGGNVKATFEGVEYSNESLKNIPSDGILYDRDGAPISDYVTVNTIGEGNFECIPAIGLEISFFKTSTEDFVYLSELLNVIPNSLSSFNANFLLDAVKFFLSDSLKTNIEHLEKNSFNPDEKIDSSLKAIAEYYYKSKNTRDPEKKECERFASETLDNNDHFGKLWWKTWEVQIDMLIDKENISNGQRDTLVNEWLTMLVLPKDYGKEENDLRFEAAHNWFLDEIKKNYKSFRQIQEDKISELPRSFRKIINNPKTSYSYYNNGTIGVGQHSKFSKSERQILIEVFRNPENLMIYFGIQGRIFQKMH